MNQRFNIVLEWTTPTKLYKKNKNKNGKYKKACLVKSNQKVIQLLTNASNLIGKRPV